MKPRLRRDTLLPKHVAHHHGCFHWRAGPTWLHVPDTIDPADLEAIAAELRWMREADACGARIREISHDEGLTRHPHLRPPNRRNS